MLQKCSTGDALSRFRRSRARQLIYAACVNTTNIDQICSAVRARVGVDSRGYVRPDALARVCKLDLWPISGARSELKGRDLIFDDTLPIDEQEYLIARFACAWLLQSMGLIRDFLPHDLAVELCGVARAPRGARLAPIVYLRPRKAGQASSA